jgi:hypothetical protein
MFVTSQTERRARAEYRTNRPSARRRSFDEVTTRAEQVFCQQRVTDDNRIVIARQVHSDNIAAVPSSQSGKHCMARDQEGRGLKASEFADPAAAAPGQSLPSLCRPFRK